MDQFNKGEGIIMFMSGFFNAIGWFAAKLVVGVLGFGLLFVVFTWLTIRR